MPGSGTLVPLELLDEVDEVELLLELDELDEEEDDDELLLVLLHFLLQQPELPVELQNVAEAGVERASTLSAAAETRTLRTILSPFCYRVGYRQQTQAACQFRLGRGCSG